MCGGSLMARIFEIVAVYLSLLSFGITVSVHLPFEVRPVNDDDNGPLQMMSLIHTIVGAYVDETSLVCNDHFSIVNAVHRNAPS
jgi:hypothetical protein